MIPRDVEIFVSLEHLSFDRLAGLVKEEMGRSPRPRKRSALRLRQQAP